MDKFPTETKARGRYLPIKPSAPHPDKKILLELYEAEDRLTKDSYVNISKVLRAKFKANCFSGAGLDLQIASMRAMSLAELHPSLVCPW